MSQHFIIRISLSCRHRIHLQPFQSLTHLKLIMEAKPRGIGGKEEKRMLETCAKLACTSLHLQHHAQLKIKITSRYEASARSCFQCPCFFLQPKASVSVEIERCIRQCGSH
jgi:hypothetical protein